MSQVLGQIRDRLSLTHVIIPSSLISKLKKKELKQILCVLPRKIYFISGTERPSKSLYILTIIFPCFIFFFIFWKSSVISENCLTVTSRFTEVERDL